MFKIGDRVRIVKKVEKEEGWGNTWCVDMNQYIGSVGTITSISKYGVRLKEINYAFPSSSLVLEPEVNEIKQVTLEEITELVKQKKEFKIKVTPETSGKVQEAIFAGGVSWYAGGTTVQEVNQPMLVLDSIRGSYHPTFSDCNEIIDVVELELVESPYFKTQQEVYKYLCEKEGNKIIREDTDLIYYFEAGELVKKDNSSIQVIEGFYKGGKYKPYIETHWYDNIPEQGVLCWVWNNKQENKIVDIIKCKDGEYYISALDNIRWGNATPLTEEKVKQYIYKGK
jgi:hypothetical protein